MVGLKVERVYSNLKVFNQYSIPKDKVYGITSTVAIDHRHYHWNQPGKTDIKRQNLQRGSLLRINISACCSRQPSKVEDLHSEAYRPNHSVIKTVR